MQGSVPLHLKVRWLAQNDDVETLLWTSNSSCAAIDVFAILNWKAYRNFEGETSQMTLNFEVNCSDRRENPPVDRVER